MADDTADVEQSEAAGTADPVPPDSVSESPDAEPVGPGPVADDEPSLLEGEMDGREDEVSDDPDREGRKLT